MDVWLVVWNATWLAIGVSAAGVFLINVYFIYKSDFVDKLHRKMKGMTDA